MSNIHKDLKALGKSADTNSDSYSNAFSVSDPYPLLEKFSSPNLRRQNPEINIHIEVPEFTSLCPMTGQPDFAKIVIDYIPDEFCVESKSLKLYMMSFRNRRDFHESCVVKITDDLIKLLNPITLSVQGQFTPRGGIPFWPTCNYYRDDA